MEENKKLSAKQKKEIVSLTEELMEKLGLSATVAVDQTDEAILIVLQTEESGILIGYHGEGLDGLQTVLSLMVSKKLGYFSRVSVDVGDYRKNRTEYLEKLAQQAKEKALSTGLPQVLSSLKPWERRVVHMILQNDEEIVSESEGEGKDRVLLIKAK